MQAVTLKNGQDILFHRLAVRVGRLGCQAQQFVYALLMLGFAVLSTNLLWEKNYKTIGSRLGMKNDLHIHPEKALEPDVAYKIMSYGMRNGVFTGKKLSDYISGSTADYYNARRIINRLDKAQLIQGYAETLEQLLRLSQNNLKEAGSIVECTPTANICFA